MSTASPTIGYISTYVPRKCGLATFTKDLVGAVNRISSKTVGQVIALNNIAEPVSTYPSDVLWHIEQTDKAAYQKAAEYINSSDIDVVSLQHEFGIFGGPDGEYILDFVSALKKPLVTTFHTVLQKPSPNQFSIIKKLTVLSQACIVMLNSSSDVLLKDYAVDKNKLWVIPHGVPDFPRADTYDWKRKLGLTDKIVMSSINLISASKGLEYAIESLPQVVAKHPQFLYLVIGQTHPSYLRSQNGEDPYRNRLEKTVARLHLENHVRFINRYLTLEEVIEYVSASDFYITPYLDPQQAASGSLSYAVGAGKVCIATPYLYAVELLADQQGVLVPFRDSSAIAKKILTILSHPQMKAEIEQKAFALGRTMSWTNIARQYMRLFDYVSK